MIPRASGRLAVLVALALGAEGVRADPTPPATEQTETDPDADPPPTEASGVARPEAPSTSEELKVVPRTALLVPRWAFWLATQPVRLTAWSYEHYNVDGKLRGTLSAGNSGRYGLSPLLRFDSGFGVFGGARFYHRDLIGAREPFRLEAGLGGRYDLKYLAQIGSGERFGTWLKAQLTMRYERLGRERFFGIGNNDEGAPAMTPIDPVMDPTAISTRFHENLLTNVLTVDTPIVGALGLRWSGAYTWRQYDSIDADDSIERYYDTTRVPGFTSGASNFYGEAEVRYDTRRPVSVYQSQAIDATGWLATAHFGAQQGVGRDESRFVRYGGEVQRFLNLYRGSRILAFRVMVDAIAGDEVSFVDLPRLGGTDHLRGYPTDRFRDRAATLGTVEYTWELGNYLAAYTFLDTGRVWPKLSAFEFRDFRFGYGGGIQLHSHAGFLTRLQIAANPDNDVFVDLSFAPTFGRRERAGRP